jgi:hypothetical protein
MAGVKIRAADATETICTTAEHTVHQRIALEIIWAAMPCEFGGDAYKYYEWVKRVCLAAFQEDLARLQELADARDMSVWDANN